MTNTTTNAITAQTVLAQLGGPGRLAAMIGARLFVDLGEALSFRFSGCRAANYCEVTLTPGDVYSVRLCRISRNGLDVREVYTADGVYADALRDVFTAQTGLDLSL